MKNLRTLAAVVVVLTSTLAGTLAYAASDAQKSFEQLKALSGAWEGKTSNGEPVQVDFRATAMGSALMSEIKGKEDMITMFKPRR
jgi:carbohydrate-selective porin OprB